MKIVLDTNVLLSALVFPGGPPEKILTMARLRELKLCISPDIFSELRKVLRLKFKYTEEEVEDFIERFRAFAQMVYPEDRLDLITRVDADNRILECAVHAKADFLVTGDKRDILPLKKIRSTIIVNPSQFLDYWSRKKA
ncbi:putative toxin-antitoxin system toxin component, PIN family [Deltaproteobacteria bacterium PRO3]|nr:putative toxin-antitoxin system toxin component, PIN family [Deltaproteobacteria bacterium PRO3]